MKSHLIILIILIVFQWKLEVCEWPVGQGPRLEAKWKWRRRSRKSLEQGTCLNLTNLLTFTLDPFVALPRPTPSTTNTFCYPVLWHKETKISPTKPLRNSTRRPSLNTRNVPLHARSTTSNNPSRVAMRTIILMHLWAGCLKCQQHRFHCSAVSS